MYINKRILKWKQYRALWNKFPKIFCTYLNYYIQTASISEVALLLLTNMSSEYYIGIILNRLAIFKAAPGSAFKSLHHIHSIYLYISVKLHVFFSKESKISARKGTKLRHLHYYETGLHLKTIIWQHNNAFK